MFINPCNIFFIFYHFLLKYYGKIQHLWGGKRPKKTQEAYRNNISGVLHNDAIALRNSGIEHSVQLFEGNASAGIQDNDNNNSEVEKNNMEIMENGEQEFENLECESM